ncbi:cyclophilin-like fold protein [Streptomyces sp. LZ34]
MPMTPAALRVLTRAMPAASLLLAVTACTEDSPSTSRTSPASASQRTPTDPPPLTPSARKTARNTVGNTAMNIRLTIDGHQVDATLNDSTTARDLATLLPLTLNLSDFHRTERIADLPRRLSTAGAPDAAAAKAGDLAYYAPWGNLALFYRDGTPDPAPGLVLLGRLGDGGTERLATAEKLTIEAAS